jgi:hypothetical protein
VVSPAREVRREKRERKATQGKRASGEKQVPQVPPGLPVPAHHRNPGNTGTHQPLSMDTRVAAVGLDDRSNGLAVRVTVPLEDEAWDRKK